MLLLRQLVTLVVVIGVASSSIESTTSTTVNSSTTEVPTTTSDALTTDDSLTNSTEFATTLSPASPSEDTTEVQEPEANHVLTSASVGEVETPAVVQEVGDDWYYDEEHVEATTEYDYDLHSPGNDDYTLYSMNDSAVPTLAEFEANVPEPLHYQKDVIVNKDNLLPILRTIVQAYTHKENPTYADLLKAGGISAFKTSLKYLGDKKLANGLLTITKKLTDVFNDEALSSNESSKILSELAEDYLSNHRFKLVLPESVLLHEEEMGQFVAQKALSELQGRSATSESELSVVMPRADPAVTSVISFGPMSWLAVLGGLISIPYFLSGSSTVARVDNPTVRPQPQLRPPGLPFFRTQQLRRDENEKPPQHQQLDQELEYQKNYAQWYHQWYLRYKDYYDKHYPYQSQSRTKSVSQQRNPTTNFLQPPPPAGGPKVPPAGGPQTLPAGGLQTKPVEGNGPPLNPQLPQQKRPRQESQKPRQQQQKPRQQLRKPQGQKQLPKRPRIQSSHPPFQRIPVGPVDIQAEGSSLSEIIALSATGDKSNAFGTFQNEGNRGGTHFKVFNGPQGVASATVNPIFRVPSPQPVYVHTTPSTLINTERGFKPIIKLDSPVDDATLKRPSASESAPIPKETKPGFRPPRQETVLPKNKPAPTPKTKPAVGLAHQTSSGGFKPINDPAEASIIKLEPETSTRQISLVTSGVFNTSPSSNLGPTTTPQPAVFFRTATAKSVRVVTSTSIGHGQGPPLPELNRPQRHQNSLSPSQELVNPEKPQALVAAAPQASGPQVIRAEPEYTAKNVGFVRTNVPTQIKVVDHRPAQGFGLASKPVASSSSLAPGGVDVPVYALDPFYGSRLSRIDVIFHQLKLEEEGCRVQVVCNIYKNPDAYTPYSDFLSRQLTVTLEQLQRPKVSDERILRFFRYLKSAREGQDGSDCGARYPECHIDTLSLSLKPIVNTFQKVSLLMDAASS